MSKFLIYTICMFTIFVMLLCTPSISLAQSGIDTITSYREFPLIGSRIAVWIVAQIHLNFAAFVLGVPIFSVIVELIGIITKNKEYDKMAKEFIKLTLMALATTAIFGALLTFFLISLYPGFFYYLTE